jgi:hypothetical protein
VCVHRLSCLNPSCVFVASRPQPIVCVRRLSSSTHRVCSSPLVPQPIVCVHRLSCLNPSCVFIASRASTHRVCSSPLVPQPTVCVRRLSCLNPSCVFVASRASTHPRALPTVETPFCRDLNHSDVPGCARMRERHRVENGEQRSAERRQTDTPPRVALPPSRGEVSGLAGSSTLQR